jgi:hypothetical protein
MGQGTSSFRTSPGGDYVSVGEFSDILRLDAPWLITVDLKRLAG